ncbi:cobyrinic acid a,c-diamide synthase [Isosphaeraceae bacterium EP7]
MIRIPCLALATSTSICEQDMLGMAMLSGLTRRGARIQHFRSQACPLGSDVAGRITGMPGRHLDSWLMQPEVRREVFARGISGPVTLAMVEGRLRSTASCLSTSPHNLDAADVSGIGPLAQSLQIPLVMVVKHDPNDPLHLPHIPEQAEGLMLDGFETREQFDQFRSFIRMTCGRAVLGGMSAAPKLRQAVMEVPPGMPMPTDLIDALATEFDAYADWAAIAALADSRPFSWSGELGARVRADRSRFRVAYARDEAFGGYFPDTLETLSSLGAELVEFSPIHDGALPDHPDLVMIGCGFPDNHIEALTENVSMITALSSHVCNGRRIYAEGGGAAYLGQTMSIDGRIHNGVGILPLNAVLQMNQPPPWPVIRTLTNDSWLGPRGTTVRGYSSGRWKFSPADHPGRCPGRAAPLCGELDMYKYHHAVGGLLHLHLAALPEVVEAFVGPHRPSLTLP